MQDHALSWILMVIRPRNAYRHVGLSCTIILNVYIHRLVSSPYLWTGNHKLLWLNVK